jgi:electron transport complex protein RnfG
LFKGLNNGVEIGTAINTYTYVGYSGLFKIMVGFDNEGKIINTEVLEQKETPGLGTKMADAKFKDQFVGKNLADFGNAGIQVTKDGGVIDAITAATITSRAFCDAVNRAYGAWEENKKENQ